MKAFLRIMEKHKKHKVYHQEWDDIYETEILDIDGMIDYQAAACYEDDHDILNQVPVENNIPAKPAYRKSLLLICDRAKYQRTMDL